jgi:type II secretory pathway component PulF
MKDAPPPISAAWCTTVFLLHVLALAAVLTVLLKVEPGYERNIKDFHARLPAMTQLVIIVSRWAAMWWFLAVVPLGIDAGIIFGLRHLPPDRRWIAMVWALLVLIGAMLVGVMAVVVLQLPLLERMPR